MAATFTDSAALAVDPVFLGRIQAAFAAYGVQVAATIAFDPNQPSSLPMRALWLTAIAQGMDSYVTAMAWAVATQPTITGASTDADIAAAVEQMWPAVAGA